MKKEPDFSSVVIRQGSVINIHLFTLVILSDGCERQPMLGRLQDTPVNAASGFHDARRKWATNKQENLE